ncbi:MAG: heme ABC exporter ATP-binding protein CcmA [Amylibacter sp.]|nr:heme ABC exporter ATP-binding protein CcmA [Amylibacter sp.]
MTVTVTDISCTRGLRQVLQGVSFNLAPGDSLILRGPNGVGKSTLLRVLAGLGPVAGGTLDLNPDDVAYSGHLDAVKFQLTVQENLAFWAGVYDTDQTIEVIARFDLTKLKDRLAGSLSAGQKRRLGLARMVLSGRKIWLMDEPTTSLDAHHTALIAQSISAHCAGGGIAILSTHLDLDIPTARTLDLAQFIPTKTTDTSIFLQGSF